MLAYLKRQMEWYAELITSYQGNEAMQEYMSQKVHAYADACLVVQFYGNGIAIARKLDEFATTRNATRPTYAAELRAILRTMPR